MRVSSWLKFTVLAALSTQALADVLVDHGADKVGLVARDLPYNLGDPHPHPGDTGSYPAQTPPGRDVRGSRGESTGAPSHNRNHNKRGNDKKPYFTSEKSHDDHGVSPKWGEGKRLPQNKWPNPFLPNTANPEAFSKEKKEDHAQSSTENPSKETNKHGAYPQAALHIRRSVQSESAPHGQIAARADDDTHSDKQGVDPNGDPIYKNGKGHRSHRNRKVLSRSEEPYTGKARLIHKMPEDLQSMPPTSPKSFTPPESPRSPKSPKKTKTQTSTWTEEAAPLPRDNQVYNPDGSFHKHAARRDLEARNEPKYHDPYADPSSRDKGVHMHDGSIAPHGRRPTIKGKSCRAKPSRA
ncbi:hypothetical protein MCOR25_010969 [Pyricularia grisea]|nr:hypothetical protein MCOR25_010969 [Pyricularia grisea]